MASLLLNKGFLGRKGLAQGSLANKSNHCSLGKGAGELAGVRSDFFSRFAKSDSREGRLTNDSGVRLQGS